MQRVSVSITKTESAQIAAVPLVLTQQALNVKCYKRKKNISRQDISVLSYLSAPSARSALVALGIPEIQVFQDSL